jgi:hypothetical protein
VSILSRKRIFFYASSGTLDTICIYVAGTSTGALTGRLHETCHELCEKPATSALGGDIQTSGRLAHEAEIGTIYQSPVV